MFKKILIANRGEIALRIIRAAKELGISVVSVYSTADDLSLHKKFGDEAICIGPPDPRKSYLNMASVLAAAELTNSDAIHPGYGFLSENPDFSTIWTAVASETPAIGRIRSKPTLESKGAHFSHHPVEEKSLFL